MEELSFTTVFKIYHPILNFRFYYSRAFEALFGFAGSIIRQALLKR
jgi:hypothetical protein